MSANGDEEAERVSSDEGTVPDEESRAGRLPGAVLFDGDVDGTNVFLSVSYHPEQGITISGSDFGSAPRQFFGSSEYEYWRTVKPEYAGEVFFRLLKESGAPHERFTPARLVELIAARFGGTHEAEKNFRQWCDYRSIPHEFFSWVSGA